jgi:hypothetical protein
MVEGRTIRGRTVNCLAYREPPGRRNGSCRGFCTLRSRQKRISGQILPLERVLLGAVRAPPPCVLGLPGWSRDGG